MLSPDNTSIFVFFQTCIVIWCLGILLAMPLYLRSQHISKNGKAECGINWCTDYSTNATDDEKHEQLSACFDLDYYELGSLLLVIRLLHSRSVD